MGCCASRKDHVTPENNVSFNRSYEQPQEKEDPAIVAAAQHHSLSPSKISKSDPKCNEDRMVRDQIYSLQEPAIIRIQAQQKGASNLRRTNMRSTLSIVVHE